jgi:hypothetical protein
VRKLNFQLQFYSQQGQNDHKIPRKLEKSEEISCIQVLVVHFRGAGAGGFSSTSKEHFLQFVVEQLIFF